MLRQQDVDRDWLLVDAEGQVLGRLASRVSRLLMGKHKLTYTPHVDTGDFVVVVNAGKIRLTGRKRALRTYGKYTGYPGGYRQESLGSLLGRRPEQVVRLAVRRMLPKTKLGVRMFAKLKVYAGADHPHEAQRPQGISLS
jgi:large subunit ribosomal protein L13